MSNTTTMFTPPLGLAYVAGALGETGFNVSFIDGLGEALDVRYRTDNDCYLYGLQLKDIVERIPDDAEIIGVSANFSFEWPTCYDLILSIRARFPNALLVAGGEHITALPEESLKVSPLDICVLGEGEETMLDLVKGYASDNFDPSLINGIVFKGQSGNIDHAGQRSRMIDIDAISWPAWHLLPIEEYLDRQYGFGVNRGRSMPVMASRGCPYQCTFCSSPQMWTTRWLARDPDLLLDELAYYQEKYDVTNFDFYDLTAIVKKSWIVDFCKRISERGMSFVWQLPSGTRSEAIDSEVAGLLYHSGCRNLSYAPESGSQTVLKRIKKKIDPQSMLESMQASVKAGMSLKCNILIGFPGETYREVLETFLFMVRMALVGVHDASIWAFSPYPGSELFEQLQKQGHLTLDSAFYDSLRSYADISNTKSCSEFIPDKALKFLRVFGLFIFYSVSWLRYPLRPFKIIVNLFRNTQESRGEMVIANLFRRKVRFSETTT